MQTHFVGQIDILDSTKNDCENVECACTISTQNGENSFYIYISKNSIQYINDFCDEIVEKCSEVCKVIDGGKINQIAYNLEYGSDDVLKEGNIYIDGEHVCIKINPERKASPDISLQSAGD